MEVEGYLVVGAAQTGIDLLQQIAVLLGVLAADGQFVAVGLVGDTLVDIRQHLINNSKDLLLVGQGLLVHLLNGLTQANPVLGRGLGGGEYVGWQTVEALHIVGERLGTVGSQHLIVLKGTLRRCPAVNLNLTHGDVRIGHHHVEGVGDLTDLTTVIHIVGLHLPLVDHEGDIGGAMQFDILLHVGRHDIHIIDEFIRIGGQETGDVGLFGLHLVATATEVALHIDIGTVVPGLAIHGIGILIRLWLAFLTAHLHIIISIERIDAVALKDNLLGATRDEQ